MAQDFATIHRSTPSQILPWMVGINMYKPWAVWTIITVRLAFTYWGWSPSMVGIPLWTPLKWVADCHIRGELGGIEMYLPSFGAEHAGWRWRESVWFTQCLPFGVKNQIKKHTVPWFPDHRWESPGFKRHYGDFTAEQWRGDMIRNELLSVEVVW